MVDHQTEYITIECELLNAISECLRHVPDDILDNVLTAGYHDNVYKDMYIRTRLVSCGRKPLHWLNPLLEAMIGDDKR